MDFLGALGAKEIQNLRVTPTVITGTVVYDFATPAENQDFRWSINSDAPSVAANRLIRLIRTHNLLDIDQLRVSRYDLLSLFNKEFDQKLSPEEFTPVVEELLQIKIPMLDDGMESDHYFIHE